MTIYLIVEQVEREGANGYEDERDQFIADVEAARKRGRGTASIEERFHISLEPLR